MHHPKDVSYYSLIRTQAESILKQHAIELTNLDVVLILYRWWREVVLFYTCKEYVECGRFLWHFELIAQLKSWQGHWGLKGSGTIRYFKIINFHAWSFCSTITSFQWRQSIFCLQPLYNQSFSQYVKETGTAYVLNEFCSFLPSEELGLPSLKC